MVLAPPQFRQQHSHNITKYEITLEILNEIIIIIIIIIIVFVVVEFQEPLKVFDIDIQ